MKIIITTYTKEKEGLMLRNNFTEDKDRDNVREHLVAEYGIDIKGLELPTKPCVLSFILEGEKNGIVYHARLLT